MNYTKLDVQKEIRQTCELALSMLLDLDDLLHFRSI